MSTTLNTVERDFIVAAESCLPENLSKDNVMNCNISVIRRGQIIDMLKSINVEKRAHKLPEVKVEAFLKFAEYIPIREVAQTIEEYPLLTNEQIVRYFAFAAGVAPDALIAGTQITRPMLIDLVHELEAYTGFKLAAETDAPLSYLDAQSAETLTVQDICDFFSDEPEARILKEFDGTDHDTPQQIHFDIAKVRSDWSAHGDNFAGSPLFPSAQSSAEAQDDHFKYNAKHAVLSIMAVKSYLAASCGVDSSELNEDMPIKWLQVGDVDHFTIVSWIEGLFDTKLTSAFLEQHRVSDLLSAVLPRM